MKILPNYNQFKQWSIPSKASFLGLILTVFSLLLALILQVWNPLSGKMDDHASMLAISMRPNVSGFRVSKHNLIDDGDCYYLHLRNISNFKAREIKIEMVFQNDRISEVFKNEIIQKGRFTLPGGEEQRYPFVKVESLKQFLIKHHSDSYHFSKLRDVVLVRGDNFGPGVGGHGTKGIPFKLVISFNSEADESLFFEEVCYAIVS